MNRKGDGGSSGDWGAEEAGPECYTHDWRKLVMWSADGSLKLAVWAAPAPEGVPRGFGLLVHGIGNHSQFEWARWENAWATDNLWAERKTEALNKRGLAYPENEGPDFPVISPKEPGCFVRRLHLNPPSYGERKYLPGGQALPKGEYKKQFWQSEIVDAPLRFGSEGSYPRVLRERGFQVYMLDQQGMGCSEGWKGLRCSVREFDDYGRDVLKTIVTLSVKRHPGLPYFVCGISQGGLAVVRAVQLGNTPGATPPLAQTPPPPDVAKRKRSKSTALENEKKLAATSPETSPEKSGEMPSGEEAAVNEEGGTAQTSASRRLPEERNFVDKNEGAEKTASRTRGKAASRTRGTRSASLVALQAVAARALAKSVKSTAATDASYAAAAAQAAARAEQESPPHEQERLPVEPEPASAAGEQPPAAAEPPPTDEAKPKKSEKADSEQPTQEERSREETPPDAAPEAAENAAPRAGGGKMEPATSSTFGSVIAPPLAVVLLAPALSLETAIKANRVAAFFGKPVAALFPNALVANAEQDERYWFIEVLAKRDPLFFHNNKFRARPSQGLVDYSRQAQRDAPKLFKGVASLLIIQSELDTMCDMQGAEDFIRRATLVPHRQLRRLDDMWHYLTAEPGALIVQKYVADFISAAFT